MTDSCNSLPFSSCKWSQVIVHTEIGPSGKNSWECLWAGSQFPGNKLIPDCPIVALRPVLSEANSNYTLPHHTHVCTDVREILCRSTNYHTPWSSIIHAYIHAISFALGSTNAYHTTYLDQHSHTIHCLKNKEMPTVTSESKLMQTFLASTYT